MRKIKIISIILTMSLSASLIMSCSKGDVKEKVKNDVVSENVEEKTETQTEKEGNPTIFFGKYEQDGNIENGAEELEWIVVAKEDGKTLLLSKYVIDCCQFNDTNSTWENSSLRGWLNNEFISVAFSKDEQKKILTTDLETPDNPKYGTEGGNDTSDKVFCMSEEEIVDEYKLPNEFRPGYSTEYAVDRGAYAEDGITWWWLRSPGYKEENIECVNKVGGFTGITDVDDKATGVRPALWVSVD